MITPSEHQNINQCSQAGFSHSAHHRRMEALFLLFTLLMLSLTNIIQFSSVYLYNTDSKSHLMGLDRKSKQVRFKSSVIQSHYAHGRLVLLWTERVQMTQKKGTSEGLGQKTKKFLIQSQFLILWWMTYKGHLPQTFTILRLKWWPPRLNKLPQRKWARLHHFRSKDNILHFMKPKTWKKATQNSYSPTSTKQNVPKLPTLIVITH